MTSTLAPVHTLTAKTSGGLMMGQGLVFLRLVTATLTLPVGVAFSCPEPARTAGAKRDRVLKRQGVPPRLRPPQPPRQPAYPRKAERAVPRLAQVRQSPPAVNVKAVLAEPLYGTAPWRDPAAALCGGIPVISPLHRHQTVRLRHRTLSVRPDFERYPAVSQPVRIRGGETITALVGSARLYVCAQRKKRCVIALTYDGDIASR